jgi:hypothetical protein
MTHRRILARLLVVSSLVTAGLAVAPSAARADFHFMEVQEVSAGTIAHPNADFAELEMTQPNQGVVSGHQLILYDAAGSAMECTLPGNVPNDDLGHPVLIGTTEFQANEAFDDPDFLIPPLLHSDGGAVCWEDIDCVSWGTFSGTTTHPAGTPEAGGIPPDQSIDRVADTNNSDTDFVDDPTPDPNANADSTLGTATCAPPGPGGGGGSGFALKGLKAKVRGSRAIITGRIEPPAPGEKVKLRFFANGSPLRKIAKKSATLNADSKFKKSFRVPSDSTRCRVKVAFRGDPVGKKTFRC